MSLKTTLLLSSLCISAMAFSQNQGATNETPNESAKISPELKEQLNAQARERLLTSKEQKGGPVNGWVSFELTEVIDVHTLGSFDTYGQVFTPDTVAKISYSNGAFRSWSNGFGQMFDPTASDLEINNQRLTEYDAYDIDSIGFPCFYSRVNHNGIDDTLVVTVLITDKKTGGGNPYDGSYYWPPVGFMFDTISVLAPSYQGMDTDGYHNGITGTTDPAENVEFQEYKFPLTDADTSVFWKSFPVDISAGPDQVVTTFVKFKPSFDYEIGDTVFVFNGGTGEATKNSFRTLYDTPTNGQAGHFWDLFRNTDKFSYNATYVEEVEARYGLYEGPDDWRNDRLGSFATWGFRFEYYMDAISTLGNDELDNDGAFEVFPNPNKGAFTVRFESGVTPNNISLVDVTGKTVQSWNATDLENNTLQVVNNSLNTGVYFLNVETSTNTTTRKIIIE